MKSQNNSGHLKTVIFTLLAMVAFAANSLLNRLALGNGTIDATSYTAVRLVSGRSCLELSGWQPGKKAG